MEEKTDHIWNLIARKFSGDATIEELAELERLLMQHPLEAYSMEILAGLWHSGSEPNRLYTEKKYKELVLRMQRMGIDEGRFTDKEEILTRSEGIGTKTSKKWWLAGMASVIITGFTVFFLLQRDTVSVNTAREPVLAKHQVKTKNGSRTSLVLPDGTKVWLNAGSEMTYGKDYGTDQRVINLTGEAYFDVVKNVNKPFIIHAGNMKIKVLGTAFNVRCYPNEKTTETSLVRGSLEITLNGSTEKYMLKPYEKLVANNNQAFAVNGINAGGSPGAEQPALEVELSRLSQMPQDNSIVETAWVNNRLVFISETFEEVARKMERWYAVQIVFKDDKLKTKKLTGVFENETVDQALGAIQLTTPFSFTYTNEQITISK